MTLEERVAKIKADAKEKEEAAKKEKDKKFTDIKIKGNNIELTKIN